MTVESLTVGDRLGTHVLDGVGFDVPTGVGFGIVGPSGAGKTSLALALLGHVRPGLRHLSGTVRVAGGNPLLMRDRQRRHFRRTKTAWLGQDPAATLTPTMTVEHLVAEPLPGQKRHRSRVTDALGSVGLPTDIAFLRSRPHEISGGQRRRVALARALVRDPALLIVDEPLAGLDTGSRQQVLQEIATIRRTGPLTLIVISHDLDAITELTDQMLVMEQGRIVEQGATSTVLTCAQSRTTAQLVDAQRPVRLRTAPVNGFGPAVLTADDLTVAVPGRPPLIMHASFTVAEGECVAVVGASGAGKTTLARTLVGLIPPRSGRTSLRPRVGYRRQPGRGRIGFVAQDPATALNPARSVGAILGGAISRGADPHRTNVSGLLSIVGLDPRLAQRHPGTLSGGQRQRVAVARALAVSPDLLVCDEPTSALDPVVAASLLDLLNRLRENEGLAIVLVTHELYNLGRVATGVLEVAGQTLTPLTAAQLTDRITERTRSTLA